MPTFLLVWNIFGFVSLCELRFTGNTLHWNNANSVYQEDFHKCTKQCNAKRELNEIGKNGITRMKWRKKTNKMIMTMMMEKSKVIEYLVQSSRTCWFLNVKVCKARASVRLSNLIQTKHAIWPNMAFCHLPFEFFLFWSPYLSA